MKKSTQEKLLLHLLGLEHELRAPGPAEVLPAIFNISKAATGEASFTAPVSQWEPAAQQIKITPEPISRPPKYRKGIFINNDGHINSHFLRHLIKRTVAFPVYGMRDIHNEPEVTYEVARDAIIASLGDYGMLPEHRAIFEEVLKKSHKISITLLCAEPWYARCMALSPADNMALLRRAGGYPNVLPHYQYLGLFMPGSLSAELEKVPEQNYTNFMDLLTGFQIYMIERDFTPSCFTGFKLAYDHVSTAYRKSGMQGKVPEKVDAAFTHRAWVDGMPEWALGMSGTVLSTEYELYKKALFDLRFAALLARANVDPQSIPTDERIKIIDYLHMHMDEQHAIEELRFTPFVAKHKTLENRVQLFGDEVGKMKETPTIKKWSNILEEEKELGFVGLMDVPATRRFIATHNCSGNAIKTRILIRLKAALDILVPEGAMLARAPIKKPAANFDMSL